MIEPSLRNDQCAPPSGKDVLLELRRCNVRTIVTVPDWVQIPLHCAAGESGSGVRTVSCCTEDEAFMVAAGLHIGGERSAIVIQNQGVYAGLNALRGIGLDAGLPLVMLIGQFGREADNFGGSTRESRRRIVRILEPLLELLGIPYWKVERPDQVAAVAAAYETASATQAPAAVIFDRNLTWDR
jgi:sulfopyruvate decarboxylase TPP-binding subunit